MFSYECLGIFNKTCFEEHLRASGKRTLCFFKFDRWMKFYSNMNIQKILKPKLFWLVISITAQKMKFSIKDFFSKYDQICRKMRIWSHLLKKSSVENFIFCAVHSEKNTRRHCNFLWQFYYLNFPSGFWNYIAFIIYSLKEMQWEFIRERDFFLSQQRTQKT